MRTVKILALGALFSAAGTFTYLLLGLFWGVAHIRVESSHATGLSAILVGVLEATIFNPIYWFGIALAFALAAWIVGPRRARLPTRIGV